MHTRSQKTDTTTECQPAGTARRAHREQIAAAFKDLRKAGFIAKMNFACCSTCGGADIDTQRKAAGTPNKPYVFYNRQSDSAFDQVDFLARSLYLQHSGTDKQVREIVEKLRAHRLDASWTGNEANCIKVEPIALRDLDDEMRIATAAEAAARFNYDQARLALEAAQRNLDEAAEACGDAERAVNRAENAICDARETPYAAGSAA